MKISFEFEPHERGEIETFARAPEYKNALQEMDEYLRQKIKYGDMPEGEYDIYCEVRSKLSEITEDLNVYDFT
jgi:fatty acid-binding protein DegV